MSANGTCMFCGVAIDNLRHRQRGCSPAAVDRLRQESGLPVVERMSEERAQVVIERLIRTMELCGGMLSGIVGFSEINSFHPSDEPVTQIELWALERDGRVERPYGGDDGWRVTLAELERQREAAGVSRPSTKP